MTDARVHQNSFNHRHSCYTFTGQPLPQRTYFTVAIELLYNGCVYCAVDVRSPYRKCFGQQSVSIEKHRLALLLDVAEGMNYLHNKRVRAWKWTCA